MKRRAFLKTVALGTISLPAWNWSVLAQGAPRPPHAEKMPLTPFDAPAGTWTLAVLPDTQNYAAKFPEVYDRQCEWIVANKAKHNILFVAHEGDITDDNSPAQWTNARRSMSILNNGQVPYAVLPGNHDLGPAGGPRSADRSTLMNDYFKEADYSGSQAFALFEPGKLQNSWHEFDTPTGKHLLLALEYAPRDVVVDWASAVAARHPDHQIILVTHAYLFADSTRYDWAKYGPAQKWTPKTSKGLVSDGNVNDGEDVWRKVVMKNPNVRFVLNGHVLYNGTGHLVSQNEKGGTVHQILANYQAQVQTDDGAGGHAYQPGLQPVVKNTPRAYGGGGFLRLMQFHPDGKTVAVKTYSPWYDRWLTQPDQQFSVSLDPWPKV